MKAPRPALGSGRRAVRAEDAAQQLPLRCRRAAAGSSPAGAHGVCEKWPMRRSGRRSRSRPRHQRQVVVLDQHRRARRRLLGQRVGEGGVVRLVGRPLRAELRVEGRLQRRLVEHVVDEPQHGVGDAVVGVGVHLAPGCPASGRAVRRCPPRKQPAGAPHRLPVAVAERGAHPHRVGVRADGGQARDEPAAAALGASASRPSRQGVGDRAAVGRDEYLGHHCARRPWPRDLARAQIRSNVRARAVPRPRTAAQAARRAAYSGISAIGGRSSVSTACVRGTKPSARGRTGSAAAAPGGRGRAAAGRCGRSPPPSGRAPGRPGGGACARPRRPGPARPDRPCAGRRRAGPARPRSRPGTAAAPAASGGPRTRRPAAGRSPPAAASAGSAAGGPPAR